MIVFTPNTVIKSSEINSNFEAVLEAVYPVGSIYTNAVNSTNPATLLGFGTWSAFGAGRVMVGYDSGDADFNSAEETGGSKTQNLAHTHGATFKASDINSANHTHTGITRGAGTSDGISVNHTHNYFDRDGSALTTTSIVQPYITVYMWKRTA